MPYSDRFKITEEERKRIEDDERASRRALSYNPLSMGSENLDTQVMYHRIETRVQYAEMERASFPEIKNPNAIYLWKVYKEEQDAIASGPEAHRGYLKNKAAEKAAHEKRCGSRPHFGV